MKKLFLFAAAAAMMTACSETEVLDQTAYQQNADQVGGIKFDVYAQRGITRGGGQYGDLDNANIGANGFGVFAYYTAGEQYSNSAKPNFMYNQQVTTSESPATGSTIWKYEPVKYWPNEYGSAAISDDIDYLTFFAYAPWTEFEPTTGELIVPATLTDKDSIEHYQKYNIISVNKNTATGDPIIKYVVDTDPATSVDLLWGVAAKPGEKPYYSPIDGEDANKDVAVEPGMPFIDLVKPNDPVNDKILFNLRHSLAKVRVSIDYVADQLTPADYNAEVKSDSINANETRIFVRSFSIEGWATEGALNLNNTEADKPLWKDVDGVKDINFAKITYFDGLKDGKEGTENNAQKSESPIGLNGQIIENYAKPDTIWEYIITPAVEAVLYTAEDPEVIAGTATVGEVKIPAQEAMKDSVIAGFKFAEGKNPGVGAATEEPVDSIEIVDGGCVQGATGKAAVGSVLLFGGDPENNGGYFYVIPRNQEEGVNVAISYDVETIDKNLADKLSDNLLKGSSIENNIYKENIFGSGVDFEPGKVYDIKIHLGMTSVKIDATVTAWEDGENAVVNLPSNPDGEASQGQNP
jgi:hypothetical protein